MKIKSNHGRSRLSALLFVCLTVGILVLTCLLLQKENFLKQQQRKENHRMDLIYAALQERNTHDQLVLDIHKSALNLPGFLVSMTTEDLIIWSLLAEEAEEGSESVLLKEYRTGPFGVDIPITTCFRGKSGEEYVAVVAVRSKGQNNHPDFLIPCLAFYARDPDFSELLFRIDSLDSAGGEYLNKGEWKEELPSGLEWETMISLISYEVYKHLGFDYVFDDRDAPDYDEHE